MRVRRLTRTLFKYLVAAGGSFVVGIACHEVGHVAPVVVLGGRITGLMVLGVQLYPSPGWVGTDGFFGRCRYDLQTAWWWEHHLVLLGGSMSTWCVSVTAVCLLWWRRWPPRMHFLLICVSVWWIDLFTYTLPSFGLRRYVIYGGRWDEPYQAATALGVPGPVFQTFVYGSCAILALALVLHLRRSRAGSVSSDNLNTDNPL